MSTSKRNVSKCVASVKAKERLLKYCNKLGIALAYFSTASGLFATKFREYTISGFRQNNIVPSLLSSYTHDVTVWLTKTAVLWCFQSPF